MTEQPKSAHEIWLLDVSGSMKGECYDRLKAQVQTLWEDAEHVTLIAFATECNPIASPAELPPARGGTFLTEALELCGQYAPGRVIVFSDGAPDNDVSALAAAAKLPGVIETIHFGSASDRSGIAFLEKLARNNGGRSVKKDILAGETLLGNDIKRMLGLPAPIAL